MPQSKDRLYRKKKGGYAQGPWYGWYYPQPGGKPKYVCLGVLDRRAAARRLRAIEREAIVGADRASDTSPSVGRPASRGAVVESHGGWTLLRAFSDFLDYGCRGKATKTRDMYVQKARHVLRVVGREVLIEKLALEDVDEYLRVREDEGAHPGTVYKEIVALRQCLKWAKGRRRFSPDIGAVVPPVKNVYQPRKRHLNHAEFPKLLEQLVPHRRWWAVVALYTAGRRSEIERLRWEHVDLDGGWLTVPGTKTRRAERTIPINPFLASCLHAVPVAKRRGRLVQSWPNVNKDLRAACERAEIPAVSPNDLRRSFASWLKQAGEDSLVVAKLLGHSSTAMVEQVYGHLGDDNYRRAVDKLPQGPASAEPSPPTHASAELSPPTDASAELSPTTAPTGTRAPTSTRARPPEDNLSAGAPPTAPSSKWVVTADVRQSPESGSSPNHHPPRNRETPSSVAEDGVCPVSPVGIEPTTRGLRVRCSAN